MTIKRKFGNPITRLLRNGTTLTDAEHAVLCSLVDALPAELRSTATSQLQAYNLVQRDVDGLTLNFYRLKHGSLSFVDDLPQINLRSAEADLVRANLTIQGEAEPLHAALSAAQGRVFTLSFSRAPWNPAGRTVQLLDIEPSWRTSVILERGDAEEMPSAMARGEPEKAGAPSAAPLEAHPRQRDSQAAHGKEKKAGRRIYLAAIWLAAASTLMQFAYLAWIISAFLFKAPIPIPGLGRDVVTFYLVGLVTLVGGLHIPLFPLLSLPVVTLIAGTVVPVLIVRRMLIWRKFGSANPPASYQPAAAVLLGICMASLAVAALGLLAAPLLSASSKIAYVFKLFGALLLPGLLSLPAKYLMGAILLYVEAASIRLEGWWPRPGMPIDAAAARQSGGRASKNPIGRVLANRRVRHAIAAAAVLILVVSPVWSVFPTGAIHERLCKTRAGELVYETVRARNYVFVGEGASGDGLHLHQALEDVSARRVDFIEVIKVPGNDHQASAFGFMFGSHDPKGDVFRIAIGSAKSSNCLNLIRYFKEPETLKPGECLTYTAIAKATSRFRVEAVEQEQARWFTPSLLSDGSRVIDSEKNVLLGEDLNYTNTSLIAFFVLGESRMVCLPRYGRKPARLHRKVLLGME